MTFRRLGSVPVRVVGLDLQFSHLSDDWLHIMVFGGEDFGVLVMNMIFLHPFRTMNKMNQLWLPCLSSRLVCTTIPLCVLYLLLELSGEIRILRL